jgi:seryl-tRNA synthetase
VAEYREASGDEAAFRQELLDAGLLIDGGVPGLFGRSEIFDRICNGIDALVAAAGAADRPELLRFPPILPRRYLEDVGFLGSFPHLAGSIFSFDGTEADAREQEEIAARHGDWSNYQRMTDLVLTPAACYPVYPAIAARGPLSAGGVTVDAGSAYVFRHEPAGDPARLQMFRQREHVRIAEAEFVREWRESWQSRALQLLQQLGLRAELEIANDPFFGRAGKMLAANQRAYALKYEISIPVASSQNTAVASFNYHQDHFAHVFGLEMKGGAPVHTACLGFGVERIALGLVREHGLNPSTWPAHVVTELWP